MKNTFSKVTALALAGIMSLGTITAAPAAALAEEAPAIEAQAVTSYYNYGDWRINQLNSVISYANSLNSATAKDDVDTLESAISSIRALDYYGDWEYWGNYRYRDYDWYRYNRGGYTYTINGRPVGGRFYDGRYPYDEYDPWYDGNRAVVVVEDRYNGIDWNVRYNDYIRAVDAIVTSAGNSLKDADVYRYFNNVVSSQYWGYNNWNDYYTYWYRDNRYWDRNYYSSTPTKTIASTNVYRLLNSKTGEHAFTASTAVRDSFVAEGWTSEGNAWKAPESEGNAVYQLTKGTKYFYTKDTNERDNLVSRGYTNDGVAFYSYTENKDKPIYRLYNGKGKHFFTSNKTERDTLVGRGWTNEGVAFYAM